MGGRDTNSYERNDATIRDAIESLGDLCISQWQQQNQVSRQASLASNQSNSHSNNQPNWRQYSTTSTTPHTWDDKRQSTSPDAAWDKRATTTPNTWEKGQGGTNW